MRALVTAAEEELEKFKLRKIFQVLKGQGIASKWREMVFVPN